MNFSARESFDDTLDLHGMRAGEAQIELDSFLREAKLNKLRSVLIITGKGLNSPDGKSVIRNLVMDVLQKKKLYFRHGTIDEGGTGVLIVKF